MRIMGSKLKNFDFGEKKVIVEQECLGESFDQRVLGSETFEEAKTVRTSVSLVNCKQVETHLFDLRKYLLVSAHAWERC